MCWNWYELRVNIIYLELIYDLLVNIHMKISVIQLRFMTTFWTIWPMFPLINKTQNETTIY